MLYFHLFLMKCYGNSCGENWGEISVIKNNDIYYGLKYVSLHILFCVVSVQSRTIVWGECIHMNKNGEK